jgi:L,D-peptidoglycan transpeptidase YkuD (ErfK/YbiS/YcfS/YnhG family)
VTGTTATRREPTTTARPTPAPVAPPAGVAVPQLSSVTSAAQAVVVAAGGYGQTSAVLTAYQRAGSGWQVAFGPWTAYLGHHGFAPPGAKREGDGRTPSGTYGFGFFFGVDPDPGVHFPYRRITGTNLVWDDDPASPRYNQWVDTTQEAAGANPEPMDVQPAYDYGAVIAYNTAATPGLGSAIFLHVASGPATAGCVALPAADLLALLTWLEPAARPVIVMGVFP